MPEADDVVEVVLAGVEGRMGRTLLKLLADDGAFRLVGALEREGASAVGSSVADFVDGAPEDVTVGADPAEVMTEERVLVDFTRPEATRTFLETARRTGTRLVIGTTGLQKEDHRLLDAVANETALVQAPNMSVGVNLLLSLIERTTRTLGEAFDVEIVEMHHRHKEDAPSGTASLLADRVAAVRHQDADQVTRIGREGFVGERSREEIGLASLRGGDVVGDHTVMFAGPGERLELTHRASSRETFARGALRAVRFVSDRTSGRYNMRDVLGL